MTLTADIQQTAVRGLITLYELDLRRLGGEIYRFHGHNDGVITWQDQEFSPIAIKADGLEVRGDGRASVPTLTLVNQLDGMVGAISVMCQKYDDFAGARLKVVQTLAEYLDSKDSQNYRQQIWYVEQKTRDDPQEAVSFELSNPVDFEGFKIPVRQITNYCHWAVCGQYRGESCGYMGKAMFTLDGTPTDDPARDACGGLLRDCTRRHGENNELPFGGCPASGMI